MSGSVVVIGAGLAGLSAAWHLGAEALVLEAGGGVGGLCRSYRRDGFVFDLSGHLLHFRRPGVRRFVSGLLPRQLARHRRRAFIRFRGRRVRYPFQAHLFELPDAVREECLRGFFRAAGEKSAGKPAPADFGGWLAHHFGEGIVRHFMGPYNRKLWRVPLSRLTSAWAEWAVPVPTPAQIQAAARPETALELGYNPVFWYPRDGGIGLLAESLARGVVRLHLESKVVEIDLARRRLRTAAGRTFPFERLVSTIPLPELVRMTRGLPARYAEAGERLRCVPVCVFNIGLRRSPVPGWHWVYCPERGLPFYRVGCAANFAPGCVPTGCDSLYVEVSLPPGAGGGCRNLWPGVRRGLEAMGLLSRGEEPAVLDVIHIPYAYVLYDRHRERVVPGILEGLRARGVHSIGRYGAWEYSAMEDALWQGMQAAALLRKER